MTEPRLFFAQNNELSEGPLWDDRTQTLYWLNIAQGTIFRSRFGPAGPSDPEAWSPSVRVGAVGLAGEGSLVGALEEGVARLEWGKGVKLITPPSFDRSLVCYNDGKVGPDGAFWVGGKDRDHTNGIAPLERITAAGSQEVRARGLTISNGLDWSPDGRWFYLADSIPRVIWRYRWDPETGIADREVFCDGTEAPGVPDGLAVDAEGCLWIARWGGSQVVRISPEGRVLARIAFPVSQVSSCAFGGPDLKTLFVTTAWEGMGEAQHRAEPLAGSVFALETDVPGLAVHRFGTKTPHK